MSTLYDQEYRLGALDVDISGRWMPSAIFVRMQEAAEAHAEMVNLGRAQIVERLGLAWVVTRMHLQMDRYPVLAERIRVLTWPLAPTNLMFRRQFLFTDLSGRQLGRASSQWVVLHLAERVLKRTSILGEYPHDPEARVVMAEPRKVRMPEGMEKAVDRRVSYSDVDMNGHMNNSKYLNWICELFPVPFLRKMELASVRINYVSEAHIEEDIALYLKEDESGFFVCGRAENRTIFDAHIQWTKSKEKSTWERKE